ncbi:MAG: hypothetical protein AABW46_01160 [Nanoarchaeota archaeon]
MSIACYECITILEPSEELPGKEGLMVSPNLVAFAYLVTQDSIEFQPTYIKANEDASMALCFGCVDKKIPQERRSLLSRVYLAYNLETEILRLREETKGKWMNPTDHGPKGEEELTNQYKREISHIGTDCLFCGKDPRQGKPFFTARVIDKTKTKVSPYWRSYSLELEVGSTRFNLCFEDFRQYFPKLFSSLGKMLFGIEYNMREDHPESLSELYLGPGLKEALEAETGKTLDEHLKELAKNGINGLRIIRREE